MILRRGNQLRCMVLRWVKSQEREVLKKDFERFKCTIGGWEALETWKTLRDKSMDLLTNRLLSVSLL